MTTTPTVGGITPGVFPGHGPMSLAAGCLGRIDNRHQPDGWMMAKKAKALGSIMVALQNMRAIILCGNGLWPSTRTYTRGYMCRSRTRGKGPGTSAEHKCSRCRRESLETG